MSAVVPRPLNRRTSLGYQVNYFARLLANTLRNRIELLGVVPGQFAQLLTLYEEEGLTQRELCERVGIEQPTMANTLQRMERDGLIKRVPDPTDGRRARVMLTSQARRKEADLIEAAHDANALATAGLDQSEISAFMHTLAKMIENLENESARD